MLAIIYIFLSGVTSSSSDLLYFSFVLFRLCLLVLVSCFPTESCTLSGGVADAILRTCECEGPTHSKATFGSRHLGPDCQPPKEAKPRMRPKRWTKMASGLSIGAFRSFSFPELRSSWPAPRIGLIRGAGQEDRSSGNEKTFRLEDQDHYEYVFSLPSMRKQFEGRYFSKCACSEQKTRSRPRLQVPVVRRVNSAIHWITQLVSTG